MMQGNKQTKQTNHHGMTWSLNIKNVGPKETLELFSFFRQDCILGRGNGQIPVNN
jgi:hypothetical protein